MAMEVVHERRRALALLNPMRKRVLEALATPASAAGLARKLAMPRQRINYHLRALDDMGFLELVEERKKGNCTERVFRAKARSFVIAPQALGSLAARPADVADRFSSAYLLAVAAQLVRDISDLRERAQGRRVATLTLETEVAFATPEARARFAQELAHEVARLIAQYHTEGGRRFRLVAGIHPRPIDRETGT
jgi:DNA-binding transcriptional ArsR family regulator